MTEEQLRANREVKVGKRCKLKSLHEALASELQQTQLKSTETVKVLPQLTNIKTPSQQHKAPAAQAK